MVSENRKKGIQEKEETHRIRSKGRQNPKEQTHKIQDQKEGSGTSPKAAGKGAKEQERGVAKQRAGLPRGAWPSSGPSDAAPREADRRSMAEQSGFARRIKARTRVQIFISYFGCF